MPKKRVTPMLNDGIVDGFGYNNDGTVANSNGYAVPLDADNNGVADYKDANYSGACLVDSDGDGVDDSVDLDDDNDGIYDTYEGDDTNVDTDNDGTPDYLDTDSDGDGCTDAKEAGFTDANNDGGRWYRYCSKRNCSREVTVMPIQTMPIITVQII